MMDFAKAQVLQHMQAPSFAFHLNNRFRKERPSRPYTALPTSTNGGQPPSEAIGLGMWSAAMSQNTARPRPTTIHESNFPFCVAQDCQPVPAWDSSTISTNSAQDIIPQTYSVEQGFYTQSGSDEQTWTSKTCDENIDMQNLDSDMTIGQAFTTDEHVPILDLRYHGSGIDQEPHPEANYNGRRMSGSSFTLSTSGGLSEMLSYEDFSTTLSEAPSFTSDYPPLSNRNSLMSSTHLSPVASPRVTPQNRSELVRTQSRGRASPSPRPSMRTAPYSVDSSRNKRWSTGSYAPVRRPSPFVHHSAPEYLTSYPQRTPSRHSSPPIPDNPLPLNMNNLQTQQHPFLMSNSTGFHRNSILLPSQSYQENHRFEPPAPLLSHGLFRMLQSNADSHALHSHYTDLSDPPDLYASLNEEQVPPPPEDMNPSDSDLVPHEQDLRFEGDLYTPRWVRGHGNKREGWCGICKPGRWLVLKNSAFWYDKSFTHGISAASGSPFQEPQETRRMDGNPDVWEGLCGSCNEWVALVSSKKKGTTWFRHAYKCHTHPKVKDAPKRRRESSHTRALATSTFAKPRIETPLTPQMTPIQSIASTPISRTQERKRISQLEGQSTMI